MPFRVSKWIALAKTVNSLQLHFKLDLNDEQNADVEIWGEEQSKLQEEQMSRPRDGKELMCLRDRKANEAGEKGTQGLWRAGAEGRGWVSQQ